MMDTDLERLARGVIKTGVAFTLARTEPGVSDTDDLFALHQRALADLAAYLERPRDTRGSPELGRAERDGVRDWEYPGLRKREAQR